MCEIGIIFTSEGCFDDSKFQGFQNISYMRPISCHLGNTKCYAQAVSTDTKVCRVWMSFTTSREGIVTKGGDGKPSKNRQWCLTMNRSTSSDKPILAKARTNPSKQKNLLLSSPRKTTYNSTSLELQIHPVTMSHNFKYSVKHVSKIYPWQKKRPNSQNRAWCPAFQAAKRNKLR